MRNLTQEQLDKFTTPQQFRDYFASIPDELWCAYYFVDGGKKCARGWLGMNSNKDNANLRTEADKTLGRITDNDIAAINNGSVTRYQQATPKARVIAALDDIIAITTKEVQSV